MTRCFYYLKNTSKYQVEVCGRRGSDWGDIANKDHGPHENDFRVIQSMGCPRAGTETNHWGWLYLKVYPTDDPNFVKYLAIFSKLRHSGDCMEMGMDWTMIRDGDNEPDFMPECNMPSNGTFVAEKNIQRIGTLKWYPDNQDQDWRLRGGERGAPVIEITFNA